MNTLFKLFIAAAFTAMLGGCASKEQPKASVEKTTKVWGNCEQCKATIEKAGLIKGVSSVSWNEDTKLMKVKLDTGAVSMDAVLKSIAEAGYDNELYKASDAAYEKLPECCQYERKPAGI